MDYDYFFCQDTIGSRNDEEIHAVVDRFHRVMEAAELCAIIGLKVVNHCALHIVYLNVVFPIKMLEHQIHVPVIGVRNDFKLCFDVLLFEAVEGAK